jgi:hypothetical protein
MGMTAQAYTPATARHIGGIRVVVCDPNDEVRAQLRAVMEFDSLLTVVAESRDWRTCYRDVDNLVPELLIIRAGLLPRDWIDANAQDTFAPLVLPLKERCEGTGAPWASPDLTVPIVPDAARKSLDQAVAEIYERKAKQLLYLVGRYVAGSNSAPAYEPVLTVDCDGLREEVRTDTIIAVLAARKCVILHTLDGQSMLHEPMHRVIDKLDPSVFVRIHRSVIINCNRLDRSATLIEKPQIVMQDGSKYPVGRNYRQALAAHLQRLHTIS